MKIANLLKKLHKKQKIDKESVSLINIIVMISVRSIKREKTVLFDEKKKKEEEEKKAKKISDSLNFQISISRKRM